MSRRGMAAVAAACASAVLAGATWDSAPDARLMWQGDVERLTVAELPGDRIVRGRVLNAGERAVVLFAADARVADRDGRTLTATIALSERYAKPLYVADERRRDEDMAEAERLGRAARLQPGEHVPLVVAWRGGRAAARLHFGDLVLALPQASARSASASSSRAPMPSLR